MWPVGIAAVLLFGFYLWQSAISEPGAPRPAVTGTQLFSKDLTSTLASANRVDTTSTKAIDSPDANNEPTAVPSARALTTTMATVTPASSPTPTVQVTLLPGPKAIVSPTTPPGTIIQGVGSPISAGESSVTQPVTLNVTSPITASVAPPIYSYNIINVYPHDRNAYTQGLIFLDGIFFEGTGLRGRSALRKVEVETGRVLQQIALPPQLFGEGITIFDESLFQLTWKARQGFEYNKDTFEITRTFTYPTEGWGITHDGEQLIMSDGSANLYFWDPETLEEIGRVQVFDNQGPVVRLNELEYIHGEVFANVWLTDWIARIDPDTGQVVGWIDLSGLLTAEDRSQTVDVLNGIAYDAEGDRLFVTGKFWPKVFEIELVER
jgi:glutamine cyclotransferase